MCFCFSRTAATVYVSSGGKQCWRWLHSTHCPHDKMRSVVTGQVNKQRTISSWDRLSDQQKEPLVSAWDRLSGQYVKTAPYVGMGQAFRSIERAHGVGMGQAIQSIKAPYVGMRQANRSIERAPCVGMGQDIKSIERQKRSGYEVCEKMSALQGCELSRSGEV